MQDLFLNNYRGVEGIISLAGKLTGTENIYLGIRPFGFHAGNMVPLVAYPIALCDLMLREGKTPQFKIFLFLNDYEQHAISGPNLELYEFNRWPQGTTIQYTPSTEYPTMTVADYWIPQITDKVSEIARRYPEVQIIPLRNSEMKLLPTFRQIILETLRNPEGISQVLRETTGKEVLNGAQYAMAISPKTLQPVFDTRVTSDDRIELYEINGDKEIYNYEELDYWVDHKPLALPRIVECNIDLCITGLDHYLEGDLEIRANLIKYFGLTEKVKDFATAYAPLIRDANGVKMSKSLGNISDGSLETLLPLIDRTKTIHSNLRL